MSSIYNIFHLFLYIINLSHLGFDSVMNYSEYVIEVCDMDTGSSPRGRFFLKEIYSNYRINS